ncbi:hypothetical protein A7U60_g5461 [Sanghuangporus baumii]|uniref:RING-type E3 ubiquitin transferase (cysteine targeting) n=1 Tax=Sanghuangporus baumii TaxID=108892 RepID=A0A9Q5N3R6_SANBA|nr:hypothetical protein A7U60_g5461 [Sanghuangporus baumii]
MSTRWQKAWEDAEPQLTEWRRAWPSSSSKPRVLRVNQLDAELLDEELVQLLQEPLAKALSLVNVVFRSKLEPELSLFIRLVLYKFSLWDAGATYGAKLQDLRYRCKWSTTRALARSSGPSRLFLPHIDIEDHLASGLPKSALVMHASLTMLVPYFHARIRSHALSNAWPDTPSSDKRRKAWNILSNLESAHSAGALLSFVVFLWNGRYRTLADRLLGMRLVPSQKLTNRQVSYEFMNRQMVWHAFTEFLLLFLPVFSSRAFRRIYNHVTSRMRNFNWSSIFHSSSASGSRGSSQVSSQTGKFFGLPENQCAICADNASFGLSSLPGASVSSESNTFAAYLESAATIPSTSSAQPGAEGMEDVPPTYPITISYRASCGHIYCYVCLSERLLRAVDDGDDGWTCLRCLETVYSCERVDAICEDDTARTSEGWASEIDERASFESDMDMSLGSEHSDL